MEHTVTKEIYIYKYDNPKPKTIWKQTYRILRKSRHTLYRKTQVIVNYYNMQGFCGLWILDRRYNETSIENITIVGNFRGWKK